MKRRDCPACEGQKCEKCDWQGFLETCDFLGKVTIKPKSLSDIYKDEAGEYDHSPDANHGVIDRIAKCAACGAEYHLCKGCLSQENACECGGVLWAYYN